MIKNGTFKNVIGSKPLAPTYYKKIDRTSDLLQSVSASTISTFNLLASNYFIAPSSVTFDDMVEEAIYELNTLVTKMDPPSKVDIITESILQNGIDNSSNKKHAIKAYLEKEKYTGVLVKVASKLNASRLDAFSRAVLSEEGVFFYLAYRAIIGHEVKDVAGISAKILDALGVVKSYINVALVGKVIASENLNVFGKEKTAIENHFSDREIGYNSGQPQKTISDYIDKIKSGGSLYKLVMDFITSGKVDLKRGTNKDVLAQKMVDYLTRIGYVHNENTTPPTQNPDQGGSEIADDFDKAIKGIGPKNNKKFEAAGIIRFHQLAKHDNISLKKALGEENSVFDYSNIIEQARLISESKFEELIALQKKI
ncbi:hypothetical protein A8C32_01785 [Flavivirga aquatica]|uniref:Uncharacterized protein n=1 Tax=Flavivirga aquatica TaxID=1849968 RepID=A0A1E5TA21_9FLAO|nr:hypothetical protein [Flavivirga aquatica]OEK08219.1 hypothetical protein A8C32_01785 [Flavivirga aquatica]